MSKNCGGKCQHDKTEKTEYTIAVVNPNLCINDQSCFDVCPTNSPAKYNNKTIINTENCLSCFGCIAACPQTAITKNTENQKEYNSAWKLFNNNKPLNWQNITDAEKLNNTQIKYRGLTWNITKTDKHIELTYTAKTQTIKWYILNHEKITTLEQPPASWANNNTNKPIMIIQNQLDDELKIHPPILIETEGIHYKFILTPNHTMKTFSWEALWQELTKLIITEK